MNRPVVTDKDPLSKKVKWYLISFFSTLGILIIVSYFSQSLAMASEGICHAPRGERLIHVA